MLLGEHSLQVDDPIVPGEREGEGSRKSTATAPWDPRVKSSFLVCLCFDFCIYAERTFLRTQLSDSKYQGYLGPQGALDSPSSSHRAHWKFKKVTWVLKTKIRGTKTSINRTKTTSQKLRILNLKTQTCFHKSSNRETKDDTQWTLILRPVKKTRTL